MFGVGLISASKAARGSTLSVIASLALIGFLTLCALGCTDSQNAAAQAMIGKSAPQFTLTDQNGDTRSLSDFAGKFVVLEWLNPECPYVVKHYATKNMQKLQKQYTDQGVIWLSINSSAPGKQGHLDSAAAKAFIAEQSSSATAVLLDASGAVGKSYGARTTPHMYVIDKEQNLIYAGAIDDNNSSRHSTVETAKNYVATVLDEALAGKKVSIASTEPYGCSVKYQS